MIRRANSMPGRARGARGFTLVELLVVISIIAVLLTLVVGVGITVIQGRKSAVTRDVLAALDGALSEYMAVNSGAIPPYNRLDYIGVPGPDVTEANARYFREYPAGGVRYPIRPDAAVFIRQASGFGQVQAIVSGIGERFFRITTTPGGTTPSVTGSSWDRDRDVTPSVVDVWAEDNWAAPWQLADADRNLQQVVYYVHPQNVLAQQYYGPCANGRPYFVSAGPDLFYGAPSEFPFIRDHHGLSQEAGESEPQFKQRVLRTARADNVYSYPVKTDGDIDPALLP